MSSVIILVGPIASGKGTAANILIKKGYVQLQYSDEIKKEVAHRNLPFEREVLMDTSRSLRLEFGNDILARRMTDSIDQVKSQIQSEKILIDGPRHPDEIEWFKKHYKAHILGLRAPFEIRLLRYLERQRSIDPLTIDGFIRIDRRDRGIGEPEYGDKGGACLLMADQIIDTVGPIENLEVNLEKVLVSLSPEGKGRSKEGL